MILVYFSICTIILFCVTLGNKAVTTMSESQEIDREYCIVIDPGHGGEDGGAVSCTGVPESSYNLEISLKLKDLLNLLGHQTKLIRESDISVYTKGETLSQKKASDLKQRVRVLQDTENAILLSIHQNHYPDSRYSGAQVFYAKTSGSEELAKQMQSLFLLTVNKGSNRQAKMSSGIYLMEHIQCPGVLIECGFLSNVAEEAKLKDPEYQKKLCCVISSATSQYLRTLDR